MRESWGDLEPGELADDEQFSTPLPRENGSGRVPIGELCRLRYPSNSRPGVFHTTRLLANGRWVCDCEGYIYSESCWHVLDQKAKSGRDTSDVQVQGEML